MSSAKLECIGLIPSLAFRSTAAFLAILGLACGMGAPRARAQSAQDLINAMHALRDQTRNQQNPAKLQQAREYREALAEQRRAAEAHEQEVLARAHEAEANGDGPSLLAAGQEEVRLSPDWCGGYEYLLEGSNYVKNFADALGYLEQARRHGASASYLKSWHRSAEFNWGDALRTLEDWNGAIAHYQRALSFAMNPSEGSIISNNLGYVYAKSDRQEEAEKWYQQAVKLDPKNQSAADNLEGIRKYLQYKGVIDREMVRLRLASWGSNPIPVSMQDYARGPAPRVSDLHTPPPPDPFNTPARNEDRDLAFLLRKAEDHDLDFFLRRSSPSSAASTSFFPPHPANEPRVVLPQSVSDDIKASQAQGQPAEADRADQDILAKAAGGVAGSPSPKPGTPKDPAAATPNFKSGLEEVPNPHN